MRLNKFLVATVMTLIVVPAAYADYADQIFKKSSSTPDVSGSFKHTVEQIQSKPVGDVFKKTTDSIKERPAESTFEARPTHAGRDWYATLAELNQKLATDPKNSLLYCQRSQTYYELGDLNRAMTDIDKAIVLNPDDSRSYKFRGNLHSSLKEYDKEVEDISNAIRVCSGDPSMQAELYRARCACYQLLNKYPESFADVTKAISLNPGNADGYVLRANSLLMKNNAESAIQALEDCNKAIRIQPSNFDAYRVRAKAQRGFGKFREAERDIQTSKKLGSN